MMESSQGLTVEQAVRLMTRLMNLADILVFTSAVNLADLENEKNMSNGGILLMSVASDKLARLSYIRTHCVTLRSRLCLFLTVFGVKNLKKYSREIHINQECA